MADLIPWTVRTHRQRVLSLYKNALRDLESWYYERPVFRYKAILMRQRFEENRCLADEKLARKLLEDGEEELFMNAHYQPKMFANSIRGNAYGRAGDSYDWILDHWHPMEKAEYPEYFARREQRKKEYIKLWEKQFGPSDTPAHH